MALNNIQDHEDMVRQYVLKKNIDEWDNMIQTHLPWLNGAVLVPIENEVNNKLSNINLIRERKEED
jgi:hypothetical protein